jgi:hypothetical protein
MDAHTKDTVARAITDELVRRAGDEVDLVFRYGSAIRGGEHRFSDLDMSWVPRAPSRWDSITVLVDDTLFDLYPLHWPTLERMAEWDDWRATILHDYLIVYESSAAAGDRFRALAARHAELELPIAKPAMVRKALAAFERVGYDYYQLCRHTRAADLGGAQRHANGVVQTLFHALVLVNQSRADTRKIEQMAALRRTPEGLVGLVERICGATTCAEVVSAVDELLESVRVILLAEQAEHLRVDSPYAEVLRGAYPELRADLQRVILACERRDPLSAHTKLYSYLHELHIHLSQAADGVDFGSFNSMSEYLHPLSRRGFPDLIAPLVAGRFDELARSCDTFDRMLRDYLGELDVSLNAFPSISELEEAMGAGTV